MFQTVLQAGQAPPSNHTLSIWCKKIIMATHRRPGYEPPFMTGDGLEMVHFGPRMAKHSRLVNVPKWSKRDQNGQPKCF